MNRTLRSGLAALTLLTAACGVVPTAAPPVSDARPAGATGFLVLAPDRGFLGNEEVRDAFEDGARGVNAELVFATDERLRLPLGRALAALKERGAREVVVLPLVLSTAHPRYRRAQELLAAAAPDLPLRYGRALGESYLAVEMLGDRLRRIESPAGRRLVVVGYGADGAEAAERMRADWQRLAERAAAGFGFASVQAAIWPEAAGADDARTPQAAAELAAAAGGEGHAVVVPFQLGAKLDSMMSAAAELRANLPPGAELAGDDVLPDPLVATWLRREINRALPPAAEDVGVVFLAHGADYHWNEAMREAVQPLAARYKVEFAFSMADPPVVERAIRRLERRGARAIVVVRVFGLAASFEPTVQRMLGLDVERDAAVRADAGHSAHAHHGGHGHAGNAHVGNDHGGNAHAGNDHGGHGNGGHGHGGHGHGHGAPAAPAARIRSAAVLTTVGGLEAHPLFAQVLLARAQALSREPARETVILVAHGAGGDADNERWLRNLEALAAQMQAKGGAAFRAIRVGTWREDWPDKREPWLRDIRAMVREASRDGGRAIVVPARTLGQGSEKRFLDGLDYALGEGFAPHPLFARWVEEQIGLGVAQLHAGGPRPAPGATAVGSR